MPFRCASVARLTSASSLIKLKPSTSTEQTVHSRPSASTPARTSAAAKSRGRKIGTSTPSKPHPLILGSSGSCAAPNSADQINVFTPNFMALQRLPCAANEPQAYFCAAGLGRGVGAGHGSGGAFGSQRPHRGIHSDLRWGGSRSAYGHCRLPSKKIGRASCRERV